MSICISAQISENITVQTDITVENISLSLITDNSISTHSSGENVVISAVSDTPINGIYIKFNKIPSQGLLNGEIPVSVNGFIHEFIPLNGETSFKLEYQDTDICDIFVYSEGTLPNDVQLWQKGKNETDILLCATHSDDDQLFFAGLLPLYAGEKNLRVRVAYFINHFDTYNRTHELLDGLWHCGVTLYPDISPFPDGYSESASGAESFLASKGITYDDLLDFQKQLLNKYKPLIAVLHDFNGEYGHGAHMLNTKTFIEVCESADENVYVPEKIYVHLYGENKISLDIDTPLESFDGKTAFNVSQDAFRFHKSQHWTWFYKWIYGLRNNITASTQIRSYNPASYGLYFTRVGNDVKCNDMTENIVSYDIREKHTQAKTLAMQKSNHMLHPPQNSPNNDQEALESVTSGITNIDTKTKKNDNIISVIFVVIPLFVIAFAAMLIKKHKK